jgi:hypothetical protein
MNKQGDQAGNIQRASGMEDDCIGSQGPQQIVMLEEEEKKKCYFVHNQSHMEFCGTEPKPMRYKNDK